ncbi:MAG: glycerol-3-phosphate dehydrogenase [Marinosulfonomonas sp.]
MTQTDSEKIYDIVVIGGGINGCGIARDAAGRGLSVLLCEKDDLAQATSSASTKLFHGGLRYLEYFEFALVRKALEEREVLLSAMPHISWPMRFVLPIDPALRHTNETSTFGKVLSYIPFLKGKRPAWLTRCGLFLYDNLGGRKILPATKTLSLPGSPVGAPLQDRFRKAFEYSDCWVNDARLVVLNARDAAQRGAEILTRTTCVSADRVDGTWRVSLQTESDTAPMVVKARALVNAGGPWVDDILKTQLRQNAKASIRLVRGSHIVVRKMFDHDQPYFFQLADGRIIFAIPYEEDFTLVGTTDVDHVGDPSSAECTPEERDYLIDAANGFFKNALGPDDVVWTYSGVRPLFDDHSGDASATTRDYVLSVLDADGALPLLSVFGGKITTFRKLAEEAMKDLTPYFPELKGKWTATAPLPGGDFPVDGVPTLISQLRAKYAFLDAAWAKRLIRLYGTDAPAVLGQAKTIGDLGQPFGATLYQAEVDWLVAQEWARSAEDILWRRTKLGLYTSAEEVEALQEYLAQKQ